MSSEDIEDLIRQLQETNIRQTSFFNRKKKRLTNNKIIETTQAISKTNKIDTRTTQDKHIAHTKTTKQSIHKQHNATQTQHTNS